MTSSASSLELFKNKATYSFETYSGPILGELHERALSEGGVSYDIAIALGFPIGRQYRDVYPALPAGTPDIPELLTYYIFQTATGSRICMCEQWIKKDTIQLLEFVDYSLVFQRSKPSQIEEVSKLLRGAGITNFQIVVKK